jgi:preprotein translocase subunit YajC
MDAVLGFFVSNAWAQAAPAAAPQSSMSFFVMMAVLIGLMYFLMIRPQQKRQKELRQMIDALSTGNEVVTGGGILGKVTDVGEQFLTVEISDGVRIKVQKHSVAAVLPKDTIRNV